MERLNQRYMAFFKMYLMTDNCFIPNYPKLLEMSYVSLFLCKICVRLMHNNLKWPSWFKLDCN